MLKIEIKKGEEIVEKVSKVIKERNIQSASLTLIGGVDNCCISTMPKSDAKKNVLTEYHEPLELSGTGDVVDGILHIHVNLGREDKSTLMGHLHWGKVATWFVHAYITEL